MACLHPLQQFISSLPRTGVPSGCHGVRNRSIAFVHRRLPERYQRFAIPRAAERWRWPPRNGVICEHGVFGLPHLTFGHVASDAVVRSFAASLDILLASRWHVTFLAPGTVELDARCRPGLGG